MTSTRYFLINSRLLATRKNACSTERCTTIGFIAKKWRTRYYGCRSPCKIACVWRRSIIPARSPRRPQSPPTVVVTMLTFYDAKGPLFIGAADRQRWDGAPGSSKDPPNPDTSLTTRALPRDSRKSTNKRVWLTIGIEGSTWTMESTSSSTVPRCRFIIRHPRPQSWQRRGATAR